MLLEVAGVSKSYAGPTGRIDVLRDVSLDVAAGEAFGLVGESGSGKTTLIRCVMGLERPDAGTIRFDGRDLASADALKHFRREAQLVFQDPYASLNPRMTVGELVSEGLLVHGLERDARRRRERAAEALDSVGLGGADLDAYPRAFSGGQRQRIAIARALAVGPRLLVCDEPVSALDVSVQAQVINLLRDRQTRLGLALLFVAHDLAVVRHLCPRVAVIHAGAIVEEGPRAQIFDAPRHPYTRALLDAVPVPDPRVARARRVAQEEVR